MQTLLHLSLEPYKERYTENLCAWEQKRFRQLFDYVEIAPVQANASLALNIQTGEVLDALQRPQWALQQVSQLLSRADAQEKVYCSDFYTPGLDALAYSRRKYDTIGAFCWAQSFDQYDFTRNMVNWMRPWEVMAFEIYDHVFVACELLKDLILSALPHVEEKIHVVGLPFDSKEVAKDIDLSFVPSERFDMVYSSRWDLEKNPNDFLNLVDYRDDLNCVVCTGASALRGTDTAAIERAMILADRGRLTIYTGLSKAQYHATLAASKVQFNCAFQDWISFTLLEALTFGCQPLYPNARSFPEALLYSAENLYAPGEIYGTNEQLSHLLSLEGQFKHASAILATHDAALDRIGGILL